MSEGKSRNISRVALVYASLVWGTTFFMVKGILQTVHPASLVSFRFTLASSLAAIVLVIQRKKMWAGFTKGACLGFFLWLGFGFQTFGLKETSASNSGFITGLYSPLVPIFGVFLFGTTPRVRHWVAVAISVVGLWILTGGISSANRGDLLTLGTAVAVALHILYSERYVRRDFDALVLTFQQFVVVAFLSSLHAWIFEQSWPEPSFSNLWQIGYLAFFASITTIFAQTWAQKHLDAIRVSLILTLEPVFAALFAWTLGGETWTLHGLLGGSIIVAAMVISEI